MNRPILISIQPQWCEKVARREKTIEVRKKRPNRLTPFTCYIYCTYGDVKTTYYMHGRGKVIGEFVCDRIAEYTAEFVNDGDCYEDVRRHWIDDDGEEDFEIITSNGRDNPEDCELFKNSCLSYAELKKYIGENFHDIHFYGWHITDLKIYDKPKKLSEFGRWKRYSATYGRVEGLKRPPISWCYVEELQ